MTKRTKFKIDNKVQNTPTKAKAESAIKIKQQLYRITTDMNRYRNAVVSAENIYNPSRTVLYQLYQQSMLDSHLNAIISQYKNNVIACEFCVYNTDGSENEEKTKLIRTKWFRDFLDYTLDTPFYGHTVIQFEDVVDINGIEQFKEVEVIPRQYVKPEWHMVMSSEASQPPDGIDYTEKPWSNWCIGIGKKRDLGMLLQLTPLVIWKKNAMGAWAEFIEKFGTPLRIGKTDSTDLQSVQAMQDMLQNMGTAAWGLFKTDDQIEFHETSNSDAFEVFDKMIERCNSEMSKIVLGQTMTTDNGSSRSQSEVHERILEQVGYTAKMFVYSVLNNQLVPLMNNLGFGLEGCYIDIEQEDEFTLEQKGKFDIELLKTGKFTFTPEYIKEKYGTEVVEVKEPVEQTSVKGVKNLLNKYYGE